MNRPVTDRTDPGYWGRLVITGITDAMSGLSQMAGQDLNIDTLIIKAMPAGNIPDVLGGSEQIVFSIYQGFSGAVQGHCLIACQSSLACVLTDVMMKYSPGRTKSLDEIESSVLNQMGNTVGTCFMNAVADSLNLKLALSIPVVMCDSACSIMEIAQAELRRPGDRVYFVETVFSTRDRVGGGSILVIPSPVLNQQLTDVSDGCQEQSYCLSHVIDLAGSDDLGSLAVHSGKRE
jgi:chemotaxis protein CheY-P-specific phosphatase CheC